MRDEEVKLIIGSLLHDIGKVVYRQGDDKRKHSQSGHDYLKEKIGINDTEILQCVKYHHTDALAHADIRNDSMAYIIYIADNIAASADRRQKMTGETGFEIHTVMQPVFNILNGNKKSMYYKPADLNETGQINYPTNEKRCFDEIQYNKILQNISDNLKRIDLQPEYVNSLLEVLEANLSFVPSSTANSELCDISLYDHLKLTAAAAIGIYMYLKENVVKDYRVELFQKADSFYSKKVFLLASMDLSGIQNFIYTISTKNALRTLRSRSFYLEIMMEHIIDLFLQKINVSRANLIYSGGGHCYLLLPNTSEIKKVFDVSLKEINTWFQKNFQTALYIAGSYVVCSSNDLKNIPDGSYSELFKVLSQEMSRKKSTRYTAEEIMALNHNGVEDYGRECSVCKRIGHVNHNGVCPICESIEKFSQKVLYADFFSVILSEKGESGLPLPGGYVLVADDESTLRERMQNDDYFVRAYGKNKMCTGKHISTKLWVGSYTSGSSFEEFAKQAEGIDRIAVLRADVDNLGHAFVAGFEGEESMNRYVTLSRTATLSRQLSMFFKYYINKILEKPDFVLGKGKVAKRKATIVYSGGDDMFIVGAWNDVIGLAVDIRRAFEKYTENTLTLSAGIGIYQHSYPISVIADEVGNMEDRSKHKPCKQSVTLFEDGEYHLEEGTYISDGTYSWIEFENEVLAEKFALISEFFQNSEDRGRTFLYNILELIRGQKEKINFARYVYLLARLEPDQDASTEQKELYQKFSRQMYQWIQNEKDCRQLKTAITIYAYLTREQEE